MAKKQEKLWWKSKTIWFNIVSIIGAVLLALQGATTEGIVLSTINVLNIIFRVVTVESVKKQWY